MYGGDAIRTKKLPASVFAVASRGWHGLAGDVTDRVYGHCDTMDGPVVKTAQAALSKGDVTPVLKWVKPEQEADVREAFKKTLAVRGPEPGGEGPGGQILL